MKKHSSILIYVITMAVLYSFLVPGCREVQRHAREVQGCLHGVQGNTGEMQGNTHESNEEENGPGHSGGNSPSSSPILNVRYFDRHNFMASVASVSETNDSEGGRAAVEKAQTGYSGLGETQSRVIGGIVPHHLLAGNMIAEFFHRVSQSSPETLVVLGPNHRRIGTSGILTSKLGWGTAFGLLDADKGLADKLINDFNALQNADVMEEEHSVSSLVPYIKYYMPDVKIVPVLLHGNYTKEDSVKLGEKLSEFASENTGVVIVASVDFSHYLDAETAKKKDRKTLEAIKSYDIDSIHKMGNDYLDSPPSIIALLTAMDRLCSSGPEILGHSNSSDITGKGAGYTTSYYTILFLR